MLKHAGDRSGQDRGDFRLGQRRHPRGGEDRPARRQAGHAVGFGRLHPRPDGITLEKIDWVKEHKTHRRGRISEYADHFKGATFHEGKTPWNVRATSRCPARRRTSSTGEDARSAGRQRLHRGVEGANMPTDLEAVHVFKDARILFAPGKAANAGGVAVSGLEMSQNSAPFVEGGRAAADARDIMDGIHDTLPDLRRSAPAAMSTTSRAPTSPASRKSPTRCWRSAWFEAG
jgi:glutamate dehydrogenase/leucine dehydrogenase